MDNAPHPCVGNPTQECGLTALMSHEFDNAAEDPDLDGERVADALRRQIEAVKAQVAAHREVMLAAGLASSRPPEDPDAEAG